MMSSNLADQDPLDESILQPGVKLPDAPEALLGRLYPEERIYSGGRHDLQKGIWVPPDRDYKPVALKYIRLDALVRGDGQDLGLMDRTSKRLIRETELWRTMEHANILPFYGHQTTAGELILVSMWSEMRSLNKFLTFYPDLTSIDKLELLHETACGLEYLHSLKPPIVHRGIKPENVIVTNDVHAALCDVGLGRLLQRLEAHSGYSTGPMSDALRYDAPELIMDFEPTPMSDVYAFGGLILTTMSGAAPYYKVSHKGRMVINISQGRFPEPKDHLGLPADDPLWETLRQCWSTEAEDRPSIADVIKQLKARISQCEESWDADVPRRTRSQIAITPGHSVNRVPLLSSAARFLTPAVPEEFPFQPGAPVRELLPEFKLEGTLVKVEKAGAGGYGEVFQGVWKRSNDELGLVAIKIVKASAPTARGGGSTTEDSEILKRIIRETTIWKVVEHPNILPFYGYQIINGEALLVSPWCKHGSLDSYIDKHEGLRDTEKLKLLCDAARGLAYLHGLKPPIAHGDIKPQNVIIMDDINAALCDFGIATVMCDYTTGVTSLNPGAGTTRYQAKELLVDSSYPTNMSDLYAFGGLILATMSGKPPYHQHLKTAPIILAITQDKTPEPGDHPELGGSDPLWELLRRCWAPQPSGRPSANQVMKTLEAEIRRRSRTRAGILTKDGAERAA